MAKKTTRTFIVIDADGRQAERSIQSLNKEVQQLDDELEAVGEDSFSGLNDTIGRLAGPAGVAAIGAGLFKVVENAADAAVEAKTLATALDVSVEEASRLNAAFGDVGIEMNDLTDIALQINGAIEDDVELAAALGVEVGEALTPVEALEKGIDNWDFLSASQRAKAFGEEGVRQISRMVAEGKTLDEILAGVSDTRIISEEDAAEALELQAALAEVQGAIDGVVLAAADGLIPALTAAAGIAATIIETLNSGIPGDTDSEFGFFDNIFAQTELIIDQFLNTENSLLNVGEAAQTTSDDVFGLREHLIEAGTAGWAAGILARDGFKEAQQGIEDADTALQGWKDDLSEQAALDDLMIALENVELTAVEAFTAGAEGAEDHAEKVEAADDAVDDLEQQTIDYIGTLDDVPEEIVTQLQAAFRDGDIEEINRILGEVTQAREIPVRIRITNRAVVDENWNVQPTGSSTNQNFTVNLGSSASMREVDQAIKSWSVVNG